MTPAEWKDHNQNVMRDKEKLHDEIQILSARLAVADSITAQLHSRIDRLLGEIDELKAELAAWRSSTHETHRHTNSDLFRIGAWGKGKDE